MQRLYESTHGAGDMAVVYWPPAGSSVNQDGGLDARYLAEALELPVLAADHPGGGRATYDPLLAKHISDDYLNVVAEPTEEALANLGGLGISQAIMTGRSAGGLTALAATIAADRLGSQTTQPRVTGVYAAEPIAWQTRPGDDDASRVSQGRKDFAAYTEKQARMLETDLELVHPEAHGLKGADAFMRMARIVLYAPTDRMHNQRLWATDAASRYAHRIASGLLDVTVQIDIAGFSMTTSDDFYALSQPQIMAERQVQDAIAEDTFDISKVEHTVHSSFDKRSFFAERLKLLVEKVR